MLSRAGGSGKAVADRGPGGVGGGHFDPDGIGLLRIRVAKGLIDRLGVLAWIG